MNLGENVGSQNNFASEDAARFVHSLEMRLVCNLEPIRCIMYWQGLGLVMIIASHRPPCAWTMEAYLPNIRSVLYKTEIVGIHSCKQPHAV